MTISEQLLEQLLHEEESSTLDFKSKQYAFDLADDKAKSELLKDILAFANAWGRSDAYILIGVEEVRGGRSRVVGVSQHLDDAKLQQFVNSKTQRPLHFSYQQVKIDGCDVGVINIQIQERPIYLTNNYGKLNKDTVYVRRGSSTDIATPEEIAKMGKSQSEEGLELPLLDTQFFDSNEIVPLGTSINLNTKNIHIPDDSEIPEYGNIPMPMRSLSGREIIPVGVNKNFYRDVAKYLKAKAETARIDLMVSNSGSVTAIDVKIEIILEDPNRVLIVRDASEIPAEPTTSFPPTVSAVGIKQDVTVQQSRKGWLITATLGKIQAKDQAYTVSGLFLGALKKHKVTLEVRIFADNLPAPRQSELVIELVPSQADDITTEKLIDLAEQAYG